MGFYYILYNSLNNCSNSFCTIYRYHAPQTKSDWMMIYASSTGKKITFRLAIKQRKLRGICYTTGKISVYHGLHIYNFIPFTHFQ